VLRLRAEKTHPVEHDNDRVRHFLAGTANNLLHYTQDFSMGSASCQPVSDLLGLT
jgi:IS1 family transposase